MKSFKNLLFIPIVIILSGALTLKSTYTLSKDYTITIHGTSNLHSWDEKVGTVSGNSDVSWNKDGSFDLNSIKIIMNVHSIKSDMGSIMNNNTYKALQADENPEIIFTLTEPIKSIQAGSHEKTFSTNGKLTIAGVTKSVYIHVKVLMKEQGRLEFEGSQVIRMTDYSIDPPTALFGTLKTGNEITINFKTSFITTEI